MAKPGFFCILPCVFTVLLFGATVQADSLPDPTQPLSINNAKSNSQNSAMTNTVLPQLQSIIYGKRLRHAVLDGKVCAEGAQLGHYRLRTIYADHVVVEADGTRYTLRLFSHKVRFE